MRRLIIEQRARAEAQGSRVVGAPRGFAPGRDHFWRRIPTGEENDSEALVRLLPLLLLLGASGAASSAWATEPACQAAVEAAGARTAPEPWRSAVQQLVRSTAEPGHPWSCGGGVVDLRVQGDAAELVVARQGEAAVARRVATPDDVVPLGQALLAMPREAPAPQPAPPITPPTDPAPPPATSPPTDRAPASPRLVVSAQASPRYAGGAGIALLGGGASAGVPLGPWLPAVWARYDVSPLHHRKQAGLDELCVGAALSRTLSASWLELRAGVTVSAAVMQRDVPQSRDDETRVDARIGLLGAVAIPIHGAVRALASVDAELAPGRARDEAPTNAAGVSGVAFPHYTLGGALGVELSL